jgi:curli biogenesis system outer membrane secretion channel CsgG
MNKTPLFALAAALTACGQAPPEDARKPEGPPVAALVPHLCDTALPGVYAARPFSNKTKATTLDLGGTDDLVMTAMTESGCFNVAERDKVDLLVEEMKRCADDSADKQYFACDGFAKKGHLLGITYFAFGDVVLYEEKIKGVDLGLKIPGLGGIEASRSYFALSINVRFVDVETGKVASSKVVNAVVPDDQAGVDLSKGGFSLKAAAYSHTPAGKALQGMIADAIRAQSSAKKP